jgi:hypothetical protein
LRRMMASTVAASVLKAKKHELSCAGPREGGRAHSREGPASRGGAASTSICACVAGARGREGRRGARRARLEERARYRKAAWGDHRQAKGAKPHREAA